MSLRKILKALDKDLPKVDNYGIGIMTMELFQPFFIVGNTQLIFTCSKSTIETLEKGVKYIQS